VKKKDVLGKFGERIAARLLVDTGLEILDSNWRCSRGEIDLVAGDRSTLVFCEVKTRSSTRFGDPSEAVGFTKAARLRRLASQWLEERSGDRHWENIRFDVITVLQRPAALPQVRHLRGVI
jgi:putative endonuclease